MPDLECKHTITKSKDTEKGSWCVNCGIKVFDVDSRPCGECNYFFSHAGGGYSGCRKHLMAVTPAMNVTFKIAGGTCWEAKQ